MPAAVGLFHKAILMSGAPVGRAGMLGETLDDVHYQAGEFLRDLDLTPDSAGKLLDMPTDMIVAAQTTYMNRLIPDRLMEPFCPTVDGKVIPEVPLEGIRQGRAAGIPVIVGWTADEWISLAAVDPDALTIDEVALLDRYERWLPGDDGAGNTLGRRLIEGYRDAWNGEGRPTPTDLLMALERDRMLRMPSLRVLDAQSPHQAATFAYQMNWRSALPGLGACHGIDLPLIFGTFDIPSWGRFVGSGAEVERLSATIQDSWVAFARTGDPNHSGLPSWPRYEETERATMLLGAQPEVVQDLARDERQVWDGVV